MQNSYDIPGSQPWFNSNSVYNTPQQPSGFYNTPQQQPQNIGALPQQWFIPNPQDAGNFLGNYWMF